MMGGEAGTMESARVAEQADEWAIVEIFGHRSHAGRIAEVDRFGAKLLRIDVPDSEAPDAPMTTHFYGGSSIFSLTPTDEASARRLNRKHPTGYARLPAPSDEDEAGEEDRLF